MDMRAPQPQEAPAQQANRPARPLLWVLHIAVKYRHDRATQVRLLLSDASHTSHSLHGNAPPHRQQTMPSKVHDKGSISL
eukprot:6120701-Alexandrium_andersonii.AAC.1